MQKGKNQSAKRNWNAWNKIEKEMQKEPPVLFVMKSLYLWRVATALQLEWNRTATGNTYYSWQL